MRIKNGCPICPEINDQTTDEARDITLAVVSPAIWDVVLPEIILPVYDWQQGSNLGLVPDLLLSTVRQIRRAG